MSQTTRPIDATAMPALDKLRELIESRTRFDAVDIDVVSSQIELQPYAIDVRYTLQPQLRTSHITGFFHPRRKEDRHEHPAGAARQTQAQRLQQAVSWLHAHLQQSDTPYDAVSAGTLLPAERQFWHLSGCSICGGRGKNTCHTCSGMGRSSCSQCRGMGNHSCNYCSFGKTNCLACFGTGSRSEQVPYTVQTQIWLPDGTSRSDYRTEYRTETRSCGSCSGGRINCATCGGSSSVRCNRCGGSGQLTCSGCAGSGTLTCTPCNGSGQTGTAAQLDIDVEPDYHVNLPQGADGDALAISELESHGQLAALSQRIELSEVSSLTAEPPTLTARHTSAFVLDRLSVRCNDKTYRLVSYGEPRRWLALDGMVEDLLQADLDGLRNAVDHAAAGRFWSTPIDDLLPALRQVVQSELNAELVESALGGAAATDARQIVSAQYAQQTPQAILAALALIYRQLSLRNGWRLAVAASGLLLGLWFFKALWLGVLAGLAVAAPAIPVFRWRLRAVLRRAGFDAGQARRAAAMLSGSKRTRLADCMLIVPTLAAVVGLALLLPSQRGWTPYQGLQLRLAQYRQPQSLAPGFEAYAQGRYPEARAWFQSRAQTGDAAAAGPWSWMLLRGEGLPVSAVPPAERRETEARPWIDQGLARQDPWAKAAQGITLLSRAATTAETAAGLRLLQEAAQAGHTGAMHSLGLAYVLGDGVAVDETAARRWFARAAALGRPEDLYNLGLMQWRGMGGEAANRDQALKLWRRAAERGEPRAIEALAKGRPHDE